MAMQPATPKKTSTTVDSPAQRAGIELPARGLHGVERAVIAVVFALIAFLAALDLMVDQREGVTAWHLVAEATVVAVAGLGAFHLLRGAWRLRKRLDIQDRDFLAYRRQAEAWRNDSRKYVDGLSRSIDLQLDRWALSAAEKDVAFLLLKGYSLCDIAQARGTSEKTARVQSSAIYAKSGLAGRSELSAFFLEDLLPPRMPRQDDARGDPRQR
jgi:DNA-binding CsgD family transcriptional regulator